MTNASKQTGASTEYSLDELYVMVASIYSEQNAHRPPSATFAHFVEVCGMLTIVDRKKKREEFQPEDALCKALGWFFPLMAKFRVSSLEDLVFRKFPYACPYCRKCPHKDPGCKTIEGTVRTVNHAALVRKRKSNISRKPRSLNAWQQMFEEIYPRDLAALGTGRSIVGLLEELGEMAEAVRVFEKYPKYFAGEAADVFSYIMGIANEHQLLLRRDGKPDFDFQAEFLRRYPGICLQCGHEVCICPSVPESTVGRAAKELELAPLDQLFSLDAPDASRRGKEVGSSVLQGLGGLPALAHQLPLDRGETNRAMVLLCLGLAEQLRARKPDVAKQLYDAAIKIANDTRKPGSRSHGEAAVEVVGLLSDVWPLLSLAAISEDASLQTRLGKLLRAQSCRIGIVTALPKEFAAMRAMLDEESVAPVAGDPNDYVIGTIPVADGSGVHLVVVTMLKETGNNSAAAAASHLLRSFPSVQDVLMVGIAGGVPAPDAPAEHVRLGDVVVSSKEGIVQYDNLKIDVSKITLRSTSDKPSARMIGVVNLLESNRIMKQYPWEEFIDRSERLESASRPPAETDKLYSWPTGEPVPIPHPDDPDRRLGQPRIHLGRIGAANVLLKDPKIRDQLRTDCQVKAIEMEGSGIADATWTAGQRYFVIRGICDYCDPKKNDLWQAYAAVVAAAYARAVVAAVRFASTEKPQTHDSGSAHGSIVPSAKA
jgi:nucleoside phosphorylase/NTP pyrophosphatase (non-canonical NTP hydrolase)